MNKIERIKFFVNNDLKSKEIYHSLLNELQEKNFSIVENDPHLCISIGGDGSFLKMVREEHFNDKAFYIGINSGTLGFLQEIDYDKTKNFIDRLCNNDYKIEEINFLETSVNKEKYFSLNEVVIRKKDLSLLKNKVYIDNELLEEFSGDGLLISTATGSTAYNLSFGGGIIYNTLKAFVITPIAPLHNKVYKTLTSSIVIPNEKKVTLDFQKDNLILMIDGRNKIVDNVEKMEISVSKKTIKCLRMNDFHFIKIVNNKLI